MKALSPNATEKIGIIGINGRYGQWLKRFFERNAYEVTGSDIGTKLTNEEVVTEADVVIFSGPPLTTVSVINEAAEFSRDEQLFMDITSIKSQPVEAMLRSKASVIGLHPLAHPIKETLKGETLVCCNARLSEKWKAWTEKILQLTGARIETCTPEEHDRIMSFVQTLPHAAILTLIRTLRKSGTNAETFSAFTTPFFRTILSLLQKMTQNDSSLYYGIQTENIFSGDARAAFHDNLSQLEAVVSQKNQDGFVSEFEKDIEYFRRIMAKEESLPGSTGEN